MPGPRAAPKPSVARKSAGAQGNGNEEVVAGKHKSFHEAATVHDRVRQWQLQGSSNDVASDSCSVQSQPQPNVCRTPIRSPSPATRKPKEKESHSTPRRRSTKWVQQENKQWIKQRKSVRQTSGGTKAINADQHRETKAAREQVIENSPQPEYARSDSQRARNINSSRAEREDRRRRRRETRARADGGHALVDDGIRVYMRSNSHLASDCTRSVAMQNHDHDHDHDNDYTEALPASDDGQVPQYQTQLSFNHDGPLPGNETEGSPDHDSPIQPSKYASTLGQPPPYADTLHQPKHRKRDFLSKTKDILAGKPDASSAATNRMPSIEAWLDEQPNMPDPFVDEQVNQTQEQRETEQPRKHRTHRYKPPSEPTIAEVADPNKIWESLAPADNPTPRKSSAKDKKNATYSGREAGTTTQQRRAFSFEVCEAEQREDSPTIAPSERVSADPRLVSTRREKRRSARNERRQGRDVGEVKATPSATVPDAQNTLQRDNSIQPDRDISPTKAEPSANPQTQPAGDHAPNGPRHAASTSSKALKRKLTTHEDLLSVLSQSRPRSQKSTRRLKSVKKGQEDPQTVLREALRAMREEEQNYKRELSTLVDGVTPVLLQSLLSKADATTTAGLFSAGQGNDGTFTRPIIDMGVALQRLKNLHNRMPLTEDDPKNLLSWAITAHKPYCDYVKAWRLGFQGVIVSLAPLEPSQTTEEAMLARDVDGDATNGEGQKVDVAYLQKRPLVRIKKLSKIFMLIRDVLPDSQKAVNVAEIYCELTEIAKQRHSDEQGRLEDEAAANVDTTKVRDIKTMGPLPSVAVDKARRVRARDLFALSLCHSTGQRLDCNIEIVLRDDPDANGAGGDVLICQVEDDTKWLLFQPINLKNVSARRDHGEADLVLMIKGITGVAHGWHELMALRADDPAAATEWWHMLGSNPLPPKLNHVPSWNLPNESFNEPGPTAAGATPVIDEVARPRLNAEALAHLPSDIDVPIGEPSVIAKHQRLERQHNGDNGKQQQAERVQKLSMGGGLLNQPFNERYQYAAQKINISTPSPVHSQPVPNSRGQRTPVRPPVLKVVSEVSSAPSAIQTRESNQTPARYSPQKITGSNVLSEPDHVVATTASATSAPDPRHRDRSPADDLVMAIEDAQQSWSNEVPLMSGALSQPSQEPRGASRKFSWEHDADTPESPEIPNARPRKHSRVKSLSTTPLTESIREQWTALAGFRKKTQSTPATPVRPPVKAPSPELVTDDLPIPSKNADRNRPSLGKELLEDPPTPPAHRPTYLGKSSPQTSNVPLPHTPAQHEQPKFAQSAYEPNEEDSSTSASDIDSEGDETDATSEVSDDDFRSELKDQATPLVPVTTTPRRLPHGASRPLPSVPTSGSKSLDPSDSASNGPYRRAPPPSSFPANKKKRTISVVCSWSERGTWEPIQQDECSIVISPGLVQAFPMSAAHSQPMAGAEWELTDDQIPPGWEDQQPLVEFELTPVVPLRKGTALDITIRSPPTPHSLLKTTNNVMFRSRTVQECEKLYQYINWARCNNPTYAQLARARATEAPVTFAADVQPTKSRSWFSFGSREKSGYRAASRPPASIADTTTSASTATSAFSALKKFGINSPFSLNRSSVIHKPGMAGVSGSLYSSSNGGSGSGASTPAPASQAGFIPGPDGPNVPQTSAEAANGGGMVNNMKVRLFLRQGHKWEALGQSLLTVLPAQTTNPLTDSRPGSSSAATPPVRLSRPPSSMPPVRSSQFRLPSSGNTPHRIHGDGREKRVLLVAAKKKNVVLLDETLGESCFEKVMQTGIAVNVWKEDDEMQEYGGVMTGRSRTYMIQFRTNTEATWVFNLCGSYRYGNAATS